MPIRPLVHVQQGEEGPFPSTSHSRLCGTLQVLQGVCTSLPSFQQPLIPRKSFLIFERPTGASVVSGINITSQICFYFYLCVCARLYVCGCLWEPERTLESPEPGVISSGELPDVDAGNGAGVLWKNAYH